ncbi:zinc transporter ZIP1 [Galendromus occidentalis]|uniref:Zinc transporter ZIP1 n=1 Tax=Galendromus occidentalis TaxID=34638 RepID=A0AAJ7SHQ2_9ACAR|nr:zinc transporter ZIP1 [Galendromus occidentalis]
MRSSTSSQEDTLMKNVRDPPKRTKMSSAHSAGSLAELDVSKILAPLLLFCLTMAFGLCPILIVKPPQKKTAASQTHNSKLIAFTACVGGGVLFATALIHIIPEARAGFEHHVHDHTTFPWTEFVVCVGFLIVYLFDEIVHACLGHKSHVNEDHGHSHSPQVIQCATNGEQANNPNIKPYSHFTVFNQMESGGSVNAAEAKASTVSIGGLITVAALSFHSIFEGLSLGVQLTPARTWLLTLAIATHKLAIAFVVGFGLCVSGNGKMYVLVNIFIFSIMSPMGASIGALAQSVIKENTLVVAILNGIAAGTLLFVTFFEVLQKQKNTSLHGLLQLTAVVLGFGIMLGLGRLVAVLSQDQELEESVRRIQVPSDEHKMSIFAVT